MKNLKIVFLFLAFASMSLAFSSCSNGSNSADKTEKTGKEYTSAYVCPMHCPDSGSDKAGTCPVCKMDYVKNEEHKEDGHAH